tara:strand:- start:17 stop:310 length:294 start_codon:yes stop_codon:yes gene_type:complete
MKLFKNNIFHDKRVEEISYKLDIPENQIEEALDLMYGYIKNKFESVVVEDEDVIMEEEEFNKTFPTIHIPSLGYFKPNYRRYKHQIKNKLKNDKGTE